MKEGCKKAEKTCKQAVRRQFEADVAWLSKVRLLPLTVQCVRDFVFWRPLKLVAELRISERICRWAWMKRYPAVRSRS